MDRDLLRNLAVISLLGTLVFTWIFFLSSGLRKPAVSGVIENKTDYFSGYEAFLAREINFTTAGDWGMGQTIRENDVVFWVQANSSELGAGDIIIYQDPTGTENLIAHRILESFGGSFQTKGDGTSENDNYLVGGELKGIVIGVNYSVLKGN